MLGFPIEHTEACLNHVSGKRGGLAAIYQLHDYRLEKAIVMEAWGRHVEAAVTRDQSMVPSLATGQAHAG